MTDYDNFKKILDESPYDEITHRVFSDWLSEQGMDSEAEFHRNWTPVWQEAFDWLHDFAKRCGQSYTENYDTLFDITYDMVIEAGWNYVMSYRKAKAEGYERPEWVAQGFFQVGFESAQDSFWSNEAKFWKSWQIVTSEKLKKEEQGKDVFSCTC